MRIACCGLVVVCLAVAAPVRAQDKEQPRLGVGVAMIPSSSHFGIGVGAGVLLPIKDLKAGSIGVIGLGGFQAGAGGNADEFGGGIRLTRPPLTPKVRVFLQATVTVVQVRASDEDYSRTGPAYSGGAGVSITATDRLNVLVEGDLGMWHRTTDNKKVGMLFFGVSMPIGKRR
jgi:hypothetical protein